LRWLIHSRCLPRMLHNRSPRPSSAARERPCGHKRQLLQPGWLLKLVNRWPASRIDELTPWAYDKGTAS
jgi:hypothetical protein